MFLTTFHKLSSKKIHLSFIYINILYKPEFTQTHETQINIFKKERLKKILMQSKSGKWPISDICI